MTKLLRLSPDLSLPLATTVTQKLAVLGISGSGKSYGAGKLVEELLDAHAQVVIVDTVGNWGEGLRLDADGKRPGFSIPILGGEHGDIAIDPSHGKLAAETVALTKSSLVIDIADFTGGEMRKFVVPFATELLRLKKNHKSPVMVVWEECQDIVPQIAKGDVSFVVGAVTKLIKKGRNYGVGTMLITQRPAAVAKEVLNQCGTLFCFRQGGAQDRKAIREWIVSKGVDVEALVNELPSLPTGTCFCWSPEWLKVLQKIRIGKKRTFDSTATPEFGEVAASGKLAPVDLEKFKKTMGDAIAKAKASDPDELRKRVAELERELAKKVPVAATAKEKRVEVPFIPAKQLATIERVGGRLASLTERLAEASTNLRTVSEDMLRLAAAKTLALAPAKPVAAARVSNGAATPRMTAMPRAQPRREAANGDASVGTSGLRRMLIALAQRPQGLSNRQLGVRAGVSSRSGTFSTYLSKARTNGWVNGSGSLEITDAGLQALGSYEPLPSGTDLLAYWVGELGGGASRMLQVLAEVYPQELTNEALGERADISHRSGTFSTYLSKLRTLELVEGRGALRASKEFFE